jgi:hypothetical protein
MTASYLGVAQKVTATTYTWTWTATATAQYNLTGVFEGYDYSFKAVNSATLSWTIEVDFFGDGSNMKITHTLKNGYANALVGAEFWFIFDLTHTPIPSVTTASGTYYPPLYSTLPASITWARLSNQFQFDWRDAGWPNGHAYLGSGSVVGLTVDILGIGLLLGDIPSGATCVVDPYFSGVSRTWAATGNSYSGIAASWSPAGVPATGDNITFDGTSVFNCNWNTTVTLGNWNMNTGYSGTITQASSFSIVDGVLAQGTLTLSSSYYLTVEDDILQTNGIITTGYNSRFISLGDSAEFFLKDCQIRYIHVVGNLTISPKATYVLVARLVNDIGSTLTVNGTNKIFGVSWSNTLANMYWNNGTIVSSNGGLFYWDLYIDGNIMPGMISAPVTCQLNAAAPGSVILSLIGNANLLSTFIINANHATRTMTFDLSTSNYAFSCAGLTIGTRGILDARASQISDSAAWSSYAGTFTPGTSTVTLSGTDSTVKTSAGESFYDLVIGGTYTTQSSLNCSHLLQVNASKSLTVAAGTTVTTGDIDNLGQVIGTGSLVLATIVDVTANIGTVTTAPTTVKLLSTATASRDVTLGGDMSVGALLTVDSEAVYGMTFNLGAYDLTTTTGADLVLTSDAYLISGAGTVTVADDMTLGAAWGGTGTTVSVADILSLTSASLTDTDIFTVDMTASGDLTLVNGSIATTDDLTVSGVLTSVGTDFSVDDDSTLAGASAVTGGDFTVDGDLNVTATTALNPDTLGLWALRVLGSGSLSVTSLSLETTEDLYVGPTASLTTAYDVTVGANWTVLGTWNHGDQVVYLTGTGGLEMSSTNSFWNITISLTATIDMDNDTVVELRATILGSMTGAGEFIEPPPVFTSVPTLDAVPLEVYNYTISQGYWDTLALVDGPAWLSLYGTELKGVPTETDAGPVNVSLSLTWNGVVTYQNFTVWVSYPVVSTSTTLILEVVMSLILGMGFMVLGFWQQKSPWTFFAGLVWIFVALAVFAQLGAGWTILSLGLGLVLLIDGGTKIAEQK